MLRMDDIYQKYPTWPMGIHFDAKTQRHAGCFGPGRTVKVQIHISLPVLETELSFQEGWEKYLREDTRNSLIYNPLVVDAKREPGICILFGPQLL